jgi:uncharacterized membrane protein
MELLVATFKNEQTAFLAQASFVRMKNELGINTGDIMVVVESEDASFDVRATDGYNSERWKYSDEWDRLFACLLPDVETNSAPNALAGDVLDAAFAADVHKKLVVAPSSVLVLVDKNNLGKAEAILRGFKGELSSGTVKV